MSPYCHVHNNLTVKQGSYLGSHFVCSFSFLDCTATLGSRETKKHSNEIVYVYTAVWYKATH